jgi:hypothetical protein
VVVAVENCLVGSSIPVFVLLTRGFLNNAASTLLGCVHPLWRGMRSIITTLTVLRLASCYHNNIITLFCLTMHNLFLGTVSIYLPGF